MSTGPKVGEGRSLWDEIVTARSKADEAEKKREEAEGWLQKVETE